MGVVPKFSYEKVCTAPHACFDGVELALLLTGHDTTSEFTARQLQDDFGFPPFLILFGCCELARHEPEALNRYRMVCQSYDPEVADDATYEQCNLGLSQWTLAEATRRMQAGEDPSVFDPEMRAELARRMVDAFS